MLLPVEVALLHQHQEFGPSLAGVNGVQQDPLLSGQFLDVGGVLGVGDGVAGTHMVDHPETAVHVCGDGLAHQPGGFFHQFGYDLLKGVGIHAQTCGLGLREKQGGTQHQTGGGAAGAGGGGHMADLDSGLLGLLRQFPDALGVADGAQCRGAAHGDDIALVSLVGQHLAALTHLGVDVLIAVGVHKFHLRAENIVQHQIALAVRDTPLFQDQDTAQPQTGGAGGGEHGMIGLGPAGGEHGVAALLLGVRQQIFQLADLVAAQSDAAQVIPLDPDALVVDPADIFQPVKGRRIHAQPELRQIIPMTHTLISPGVP